MGETAGLAITRQHGFDRICLVAPERRNAMSLAMIDAIVVAVERSAADDTCRGVIIDHDGSVFCSGVDLAERRALPAGARNHSEALAALYNALWVYPKPVVCRVDGAVRGGGLGLVALADITVASVRASFAFTEVRVGVAPALVGVVAVARLGPGRLEPWLLSGETLDARQAVETGLATELVDGDGSAEVERWVTALGRAAPGAVRVTKQLTRRFVGARDLPAEIAEMLTLSAALFDSDEGREGMAAFADKRPPAWVN